MADQKITELQIKTSTGINLTDYLLGIDSAEGYQMLVSDIAKKIVEDYAGSTLLGQSQSIASAVNTTKTLMGAYSGALPGTTDMNTVVAEGIYNASNANAKNMTNLPSGVDAAFMLTVERCLGLGSNWLRQTLTIGASAYTTYRRYSTDGGTTWKDWEQMPTRSEMDGAYSLINGPRPEVDIDWNTLTSSGTFFFNSVPTGDNKPIADKGKLIVERRLYNARDVRQTFYPATQSNGLIFVRTGSTNGTWEAWEKVPTRAEIDKISDITGIFSTNLAISGSSSEQYTVPNGSQHLVILHGASNTVHGLYLVAASPNGVMYSTEITKGTNLTVTTPSNNTLQIANAFTNGCYFTDICLRGSAITKVTAGTNSAQSESI